MNALVNEKTQVKKMGQAKKTLNFTQAMYKISRHLAIVLSLLVSISWTVEFEFAKAFLNLALLVLFIYASKLFEKRVQKMTISYMFFYLIVYLVYTVCACYYTEDRMAKFSSAGFQGWGRTDYYYTYFLGIFLVYILIIIYLKMMPVYTETSMETISIKGEEKTGLAIGSILLIGGYILTKNPDVIIPVMAMLLCLTVIERRYRLLHFFLFLVVAFAFREIVLSRFQFVQVMLPAIVAFLQFTKYNQKKVRLIRAYGILLIGLFIIGIYGTVSEIYKLNTVYNSNYGLAEVFGSWKNVLFFFERQLYRITTIWIKLGGYILYHVDRIGHYYWGITYIKPLSGLLGFEYVSLPVISATYNQSTYAQPGLFAEGYANFGIIGATLNIFIVFLFMEFTRRCFNKNKTFVNVLFMTVPFTKILLDGGTLNSAIMIYLILLVGTSFGNLRIRARREC